MSRACVFCGKTETSRWFNFGEAVSVVCNTCAQKWYRMGKDGMKKEDWIKEALRGNIIDRTKKVANQVSAAPRIASSTINKDKLRQVASCSSACQRRDQQSASGNSQHVAGKADEDSLKKCDCPLNCDREVGKIGDGEKRCTWCGFKTSLNGNPIESWKRNKDSGEVECPACYQFSHDTGLRRPVCATVRREQGLRRKKDSEQKKLEEMQKRESQKSPEEKGTGVAEAERKLSTSGSTRRRIAETANEDSLRKCNCTLKCDREVGKIGDGEKRCTWCGFKTSLNGKPIESWKHNRDSGEVECPACYQFSYDTEGLRRPVCATVRKEQGLRRKKESERKKLEKVQRKESEKSLEEEEEEEVAESLQDMYKRCEGLRKENVQEAGNGESSLEDSKAENDGDVDMEAERDKVTEFENDENVELVKSPSRRVLRGLQGAASQHQIPRVENSRAIRRRAPSSSTSPLEKKKSIQAKREERTKKKLAAETQMELLTEIKWEHDERWNVQVEDDGDPNSLICVFHMKNNEILFVDDENFDYGFVTEEELKNAAEAMETD